MMRIEKRSQEDFYADVTRYPGMYLGNVLTAHLYAILNPVKVARTAIPFRASGDIHIDIAPEQFEIACETGSLDSQIDSKLQEVLAERREEANLFEILFETGRLLARESDDKETGWWYYFGSSHGLNFEIFPFHPYLTIHTTVTIRTSAGYLSQTFDLGDPTSNPFFVQATSSIGLYLAAHLDPRWFTGLPFVKDQVMHSIPDEFHPNLHIHFHEHNDLRNGSLKPEDLILETLYRASER